MGTKCVKSEDQHKLVPAFTYQNMIKYITTALVTSDYEIL
jgi:hypothetical protein